MTYFYLQKKKKMMFSLLQRNQIFGMVRAILDYKRLAASLHRWENKEERN